MRNLKLAAALVAASVSVLGACGSSGSSTSPISGDTADAPKGDPIVVGIDIDSTSAGSAYSVRTGDALKVAVEKVNKEGGVLDRPLKVITSNSEGDPTKGAAVARKLISEGADAVFLTASSAANITMKPILQKEKVVAIAPTSSSADFIKQPNADYVYAVAPFSDTWPKIYCSTFKNMDIKSVGVITENSPTFTGLNKFLIDDGIKKCVDITTEEKVDPSATDVTSQVVKIKDSNPDAVLVSTSGGSFETLIQNTLSQTMADTPRFTIAALANQPDQWESARPGALEGLMALSALDTTNPESQKVAKYFKSVKGDDFTLIGFDAMSYDSVYLLKEAIEKAGSVDGAAVKKAMDSISDYKAHYGSPGFTLSYSATKHDGPDNSCGYLLAEFTADNELGGPAPGYKPTC